MRRQLHEYKMQKGGSVMDDFLKLDELCIQCKPSVMKFRAWAACDATWKLSDEYDQIVKIIEDMGEIDLFLAKAMLRREYEGTTRKANSRWRLQEASRVRIFSRKK